ncbi:MAG: gamma-glutamyltransferase family protein [Desulfurococcales archaeon]|nr:gamma-glutamyltransferase family protein [Desulfurococcales archaeon]
MALASREYPYSKLAIASENPLASSIGFQIASKGGNPIDVSIATSIALAVTIPHLGGLGGDYFALIHTPDNEVKIIMGSGQSPAKLTLEKIHGLEEKWKSMRGPLTIVVPGMIDALYTLWRKFGSLEWRDLLTPSITIAREGFPAPPAFAYAVKRYLRVLYNDPGSRKTYLYNGPIETGQKVNYPGMARLLEILAEDPKALYKGEIADAIEEYLQNHGGLLTKGDMKNYQAYLDEPLVLESYHGWTIYEMPPNTQGATTLHLLKLLQNTPYDPVKRLPILMEKSRIAYSVRDLYIGDTEHMTISRENLLSDTLLEETPILEKYKPNKCNPLQQPKEHDTTFHAVASKDGWYIAAIQSLYYHFGSGLTEPTYQITLNNRAIGFEPRPGLPNSLGPEKRPLHTLSAVLAQKPESNEILVLGTSGGQYRPQQHALMISNIIEHKMNVGQALAATRTLWTPGTCNIVADPGVSWKDIPPGYTLTIGRTGVASAIYYKNNVLWTATDPRGDGYPAGI